MIKIVFATHNLNKFKEVKQLLSNNVLLLSLTDIQCFDEIPEDHETPEENALQKAKFVYEKYHINCFADDTGLEVEALNGAPGVYAARYAGPEKNPERNIQRLLKALKGENNRKAQFKTMIALIMDGVEYLFEGIVKGKIRKTKKGNRGFGYDPVFVPNNYKQTFAEMSMEEKNVISHRSIAIRRLVDFFQQLN